MKTLRLSTPVPGKAALLLGKLAMLHCPLLIRLRALVYHRRPGGYPNARNRGYWGAGWAFKRENRPPWGDPEPAEFAQRQNQRAAASTVTTAVAIDTAMVTTIPTNPSLCS